MRVLHHVGIAVRSIEERLELYRALGLSVEGTETVASEKVRAAFLPVEGSRIELLEATAPDSPIAAAIAKRGEGLHHLCFQVDDVRAAMASLAQRGYQLLSDEPRRGAHGAQVCFVHPKSAGGVLIELWQDGAEADR